MRSFDPRRVGSLECRAWETYYRRKWGAFLVASVGLVRARFRMSWPRTLVGAWLVLRANMVWAPFPDNDPDKAPALMRRFYQLLRKSEAASFDPRAPRSSRSSGGASTASTSTRGDSPEGLIVALRDLYAYTYGGRPRGRARGGAAARGGDGRVGPLGRGRQRPGEPAAGRGARAAGALLRRAAGGRW